MPEKRLDVFAILALIPGTSLLFIWMYVQGFDGWGRWGAAPLLLLPVLVSVPLTLAGVLRIRGERTRGSLRTATILFTTIAAIPLLWFVWRLAVS